MSYKTYGKASNTKVTPQSQPIPGSNQVKNEAGGFVFAVDDWKRLDRFLILGSEGGTYYASEKDFTKQNLDTIERCIASDGMRVVSRAVEFSTLNRAIKNETCLFVLALCASHGNDETRKAAFSSLGLVARTGTHLFHFVGYVDGMRGWGRGLRNAVAEWYNGMPAEKLAYQLVKYQQRDGWSNRDLLRKSHAKPIDDSHSNVFKWATRGYEGDVVADFDDGSYTEKYIKTILAFERAKVTEDEKEIVKLITDYGLPREAIPTKFLNSVPVWEALLEDMPMTATIRNLGKMSSIGLLTPMSAASKLAVERIDNADALIKARVHPFAILVAMKTYENGRGDKGSLKWSPVSQVVDALDSAFYKAFGAVQPIRNRVMLALDVSGSMSSSMIANTSISAREGVAAMALVTANVEKEYMTTIFSSAGTNFFQSGERGYWGSPHGLSIFDISPRQRLDDVVRKTNNLPFGGTDCALPMLFASNAKLIVDTFIIYTDSETWAGSIHPTQALREYRNKYNPNARLVVVGMTSNGFSIADPNDAGSLDVCGFDTASPNVISDFARGDL